MKRRVLQVQDSNPLLTVPQAAGLMGVSESTIWRLLRRRSLESVKREGRRMIPRRSIEKVQRAEERKEEFPVFDESHPFWRFVGIAAGRGLGPGSADKYAMFDDASSVDKYGLRSRGAKKR